MCRSCNNRHKNGNYQKGKADYNHHSLFLHTLHISDRCADLLLSDYSYWLLLAVFLTGASVFILMARLTSRMLKGKVDPW